MAHRTGMAAAQRRALDRLTALGGAGRFYLAGGAAVAFHLAHRESRDLDLFSLRAAASFEPFRRAARAAPREVQVVGATDVTLKLQVLGVPVDVVRYPYPPLERPTPGPQGFPVARPLDLAVMKLSAIASRGIRRDFWDLRELVRSGVTLREAGAAYVKRYGVAEGDLYHVWRALTYFADAEGDTALPLGMSPRRWEAIKRFFEKQARALVLGS